MDPTPVGEIRLNKWDTIDMRADKVTKPFAPENHAGAIMRAELI